MSDSVHLRNAKALDARNKQMSAEADVLRDRMRHLENQVAMMRSDVIQLQQQLTVLLASRGTGATARS
jgi:hypothetical protein